MLVVRGAGGDIKAVDKEAITASLGEDCSIINYKGNTW